jgi:hypothetical protein
MPGMFQIILIYRIVHHPEPIQFMIANLHSDFEVRLLTGWFQITMLWGIGF